MCNEIGARFYSISVSKLTSVRWDLYVILVENVTADLRRFIWVVHCAVRAREFIFLIVQDVWYL